MHAKRLFKVPCHRKEVHIFILYFLFSLLSSSAFADVHLVVFDFRGKGVDYGELDVIFEEVRTGVLNTIKDETINGKKITLMGRENMMEILTDQGISEEDCSAS